MKKLVSLAARSTLFLGVAVVVCSLVAAISPVKVNAAACAAPSSDYGAASMSISIPATATYRVWSRIMAPNATNNSYLLEVDGNKCFTVGGKSITANSWVWIDYQNGDTASKTELQLSKGSHALRFIGRQADVKLDRVITTSDLGCVPTGNGTNCDVPSDTKPPTISITAPPENGNVSKTVAITANASDDVAVKKVEFYANSTLLGADTAAPYTYSWDTTKVPNGRQLLIAKAYDAAGNVSADSYGVWTKNGDTQAPTAPGGLSAKTSSHSKVSLTWKASTDNTGVAGYRIIRDGIPVATVGTVTMYDDTNVLPNTEYAYKVTAYDAAGNVSGSSDEATAKTPNVTDKQAPATPVGLSAKAVGTTQANLTWQPSTDNIGIAVYEVYRQASGSAKKIAEVNGTSFGDAALSPGTSYTYYVVARDTAGNRSKQSAKTTVRTGSTTKQAAITGRTFSSKSNKPTVARIEIMVGGSKRTYTSDKRGEYAITGLKPGSYNVTYSKSTYHSQSFTIKVGDTAVKRDVTLRLK